MAIVDTNKVPQNWINVSKNRPCKVCGKPDWCSESEDGKHRICRREGAGATAEKVDSAGGTYWVHSDDKEVHYRTQPAKKLVPHKTDESELLNDVYNDLLKMVPVVKDHQKQMLLERGFEAKDIVKYGSLSGLNDQIISKLHEKYGYKLKKVPGIHLHYSEDGCLIGYKFPVGDGTLIPGVDEAGKIKYLKIRKDRAAEGQSRYIYFSMSKIEGSPKVEQSIHVAGKLAKNAKVILTEGELKADLIYKKLDVTTLSCPGVGSVKLFSPLLEKYNPCEIILAFDRDMEDKKQVAAPVIRLFASLVAGGCKVTLAIWNNQFKGLDDALVANQPIEYLDKVSAEKYFKDVSSQLNLELNSLQQGYPEQASVPLERWDTEWPEEPESFDKSVILPEVVPEDLPEFLREYAFSCARRASFSIEYLVVSFFSVVASLIGRKLAIKPKRNDNWTVIPVFWSISIGRPSVKKSPALDAAVKFLEILDEELTEENLKQQSLWSAERLMLEEEKAALLRPKKARKKDSEEQEDSTSRDNLKEKLAEIEYKLKNGKPPFRKLYAVDATKEKIVEIIRDNPHGILLNRDELSGLFQSFDMSGKEQDRSFYLSCFNGDSPYLEDRKTRDSVHLKALILSITGTIQPGVISSHIRKANEGEAGADGLMARFSGAVYPARPKFNYIDESPNMEDFEKILNGLRRLRELDAFQLGVEEATKSGVPYTGFDEGAQQCFEQWLTTHEKQLEEGDMAEGLEAHMGKYPKALCTLALIFHMLEWVQLPRGTAIGKVSNESLKLAIRWMEILSAHAKVIYDGASNKKKAAASTLLDKIDGGQITHFMTVRELYRKGWSGLTDKRLVLEACKELSGRGFLKIVKLPVAGKPNIASEVIVLHPLLRKKEG
jgi:putative DNA primase/helicase